MNSETIQLVKQSDSTIIILIVVFVMSMITLLPIIKLWVTTKEINRKREIEQQDKIIAVIQANTEVNASLKSLLEEDHKHCEDCKKDQLVFFRQLQDNQDLANLKIVEIHSMLRKGGDR